MQSGRTHTVLRRQKFRITVLQNELQTLEQSITASTSEEHDAFESLAKAECMQICNRVMTQLPREIRDMVYRQLSTSHEERIDREYFRSTMDPVTKLHTYDCDRWKLKYHPQHFWIEEFVGADFFRELVENHYRTSTFIFGDDNGLIERFLHKDHMKMGYSPGELVSKMEIHLNAITFDRTSCIEYMFGCPTKPERLSAAIIGIEKLRPGASVVVNLSTQATDEKQKEEQILTACVAICPSLREARMAGKRVRLMIDNVAEIQLDDDHGDYRLRDIKASG
ncbi:hypothetical protein EK21DRAFT_115690 [Setomelanomma holmii]|uniref:Uncharacterized protein n=1 Tax=Setomelanomma holmii TaxID=210430 RepID=A0A9P4H4J2_9PLEO|nr:hypothetical protein EK21DRAFT_115690 [Setomelanomma holmii]